jgi:uncharacterized membrane protein YhaH (DUF805 family)
VNYYVDVWRDYFDFSGRARRKEYWIFTLYHTVILVSGELLVGVLANESSPIAIVFTLIYVLYVLASIIPTIAVSVRRLHDIDKSGWWLFIGLIPVVGAIWSLILMCTDGTNGPNQYGPDPKALEAYASA